MNLIRILKELFSVIRRTVRPYEFNKRKQKQIQAGSVKLVHPQSRQARLHSRGSINSFGDDPNLVTQRHGLLQSSGQMIAGETNEIINDQKFSQVEEPQASDLLSTECPHVSNYFTNDVGTSLNEPVQTINAFDQPNTGRNHVPWPEKAILRVEDEETQRIKISRQISPAESEPELEIPQILDDVQAITPNNADILQNSVQISADVHGVVRENSDLCIDVNQESDEIRSVDASESTTDDSIPQENLPHRMSSDEEEIDQEAVSTILGESDTPPLFWPTDVEQQVGYEPSGIIEHVTEEFEIEECFGHETKLNDENRSDYHEVIDEISEYFINQTAEHEIMGGFGSSKSVQSNELQFRSNATKKTTTNPFKHNTLEELNHNDIELDVDAFLEDLRSDNLDAINSLGLAELDHCFFKALSNFESIGDLPISETVYNHLIGYIRDHTIERGESNPRNCLPTILLISMVYCARYSETEARDFWKPYARQVWDRESTQYFQYQCRRLFTYSRKYLADKLKLTFNLNNEGDVVRPVYQHAIIPYYLMPYLAEWLVGNFEKLLVHEAKDLPQIIEREKSLDHMPPRLQNFIRGEDTKDTAAQIISRMANAIKLFHDLELSEQVGSVINSPIEQSLWQVTYKKLSDDQSRLSTLRSVSPRLQWQWDLERDEMQLNLTNIRSARGYKPDSLICSGNNAQNLNASNIHIKLFPWKMSNGDWEVDPIIISADGPVEGSVYVLSENYDLNAALHKQQSNVIFQRTIPALPTSIMYFKVNQRGNVANQKDEIDSDGSWIIVSKEKLLLVDNADQPNVSRELNIPVILSMGGFTEARQYSIHLPIKLKFENEVISFEKPKAQNTIIAFLEGNKPIPGLSIDVPPVFQSNEIKLIFNYDFNLQSQKRIWLSISRNGKFLQSILLTDLIRQGKLQVVDDGQTSFVNLSSILDQHGAYSVSLLHNLTPLLDNPVQFAWIPKEIDIVGPQAENCYSPQNPLQVTLIGINEEQIVPTQDEKVKLFSFEGKVIVEWREVKSPYCQFSIRLNEAYIRFKWKIDRVSAWLDDAADMNQVYEENDQDVCLNVRGKPKEVFYWIVGEQQRRRDEQLDAKGTYREKLKATSVRDMIVADNRAKTAISISIRNNTWHLFDYYQTPEVTCTTVTYQQEKLRLTLAQARKLVGSYKIQLRHTSSKLEPQLLANLLQLENELIFQVQLKPGEYVVDVLMYENVIATSTTFLVAEKFPSIKNFYPADDAIDWRSPDLVFRVLTARGDELLKRSFDKSPVSGIIGQLQIIHTEDEWLTNEHWDSGFKRLIPSWAVMMYPLRFTTKIHGKILHVFPEKVAYGARAGRGYIEIKLNEQKTRLAASWRPGVSAGYSHLWMGISQQQDIRYYSELDQDELWPAYQCKSCGQFVASREGTYLKLSPSLMRLHLHGSVRNLSDQFIDTVYDKVNIVEVLISQYKDKELQHAYQVEDVVLKNYLRFLIDGKTKPIHGHIKLPVNMYKVTDYCIAMSETFKNIQLIEAKKFFTASKSLQPIIRYIAEQFVGIPAFSAMQRLIAILDDETLPYNPSTQVLYLAMVLRLRANLPERYEKLMNSTNITESTLIELLDNASQAYPKLLEWSIAWAEIFYLHAIS